MSSIEIVKIVASLVSVFVESTFCLYACTVATIRQRQLRKMRGNDWRPIHDKRSEQYGWSSFESDAFGIEPCLDRHLGKSVTIQQQEEPFRICVSLKHALEFAASFRKYLWRGHGHCHYILTKSQCAPYAYPNSHDERMNATHFSRTFALPEIIASKDCEIEVGGMEEKLVEKSSSHIESAGSRRCEDMYRGVGGTRISPVHCMMLVAQVVRLVGGMFMLYPACMLVMGNYAMENGLSTDHHLLMTGMFRRHQEINPLEAHGLEVKHSMAVSRILTDISKGILVARIMPDFVLEPSAPLFFAASMTWAFLEWAHYQSNVSDQYQGAILGIASTFGFLAAIGRGKDMLTMLFCTMPWVMHLSLLVSDVFHRVKRISSI